MSSPSPSLSRRSVLSFGALSHNAVRFFHSVLPSHNLCFYAGDTHFYSHLILTLRVTSLDSHPKSDKVDQPAVPKVQIVSILGGPKMSEGVQILL